MSEYLYILEILQKVFSNRQFIYNRHHYTLGVLEAKLNSDIENINYRLNYNGFPTSKNIKEALYKRRRVNI